MPDFTMRLRDVMELERYAEKGPRVIGLATYPIFDEDYREALNEKIIRRYYMQEIAHESISLFRMFMNREMHEIMPYYNKLYESERLDIDPLNTVNLRTLATQEFTTNTDNTASNSATGNVTSGADSTTQAGAEALAMEYPQQQLNTNGRYATSGTKSENATTSNSSGTEESTQESTQTGSTVADGDSTNDTTQTGWSGSQADLLMRYRETFLNIDVMILDALSPLFMGLWGTGSSHYSDGLAFPASWRSGSGGFGPWY